MIPGLLAVMAIVAAACGGGASETEPAADGADTAAADTAAAEPDTSSESTTPDSGELDGAGVDDETAPEDGPTDGEQADVVTAGDEPDEQEPAEQTDESSELAELQPEVWQSADVGVIGDRPTDAVIAVIGESIWVAVDAWDGALVVRSNDGGTSFESVDILGSRTAGFDRASIEGLVGSSDQLVAWGRGFSGCVVTDVGGGQRAAERCRSSQAIVFVSSDGGDSWRRAQAPALAPVGDQDTRIWEMVVHRDRFVAVGGVRGLDWHGRIWESPDGEQWDVVREIRSDRGSTEAVDVVSDGVNLLVHWTLATCAFEGVDPSRTSAPSWTLGAFWPSDANLLIGTDAASLTAVSPSASPIVPEARDADCAESEPFDLAAEGHPSVAIEVLDGQLALFERLDDAGDEVEIDDARDRFGPLRYAVRVDGEWRTTTLEAVPTYGDGFASDDAQAFARDGVLEFLFRSGSGRGTAASMRLVALQADSAERVSLPPFAGFDLLAHTRNGDRTIAVYHSDQATDANDTQVSYAPVTVTVAVHTPGTMRASCDLVAGGSCRYGDVRLVDGYPDFSEHDLTGIDLSYANLGSADFSGAVLDGALLLGTNARRANFASASLRDVDASHAVFSATAGADFTGAELFAARLSVVDLPILDGAGLFDARIAVPSSVDDDAEAIAVSLAGLDLRRTRISGPFRGPLLVITDLTGATINELTTFDAVDLTAVSLGDVDLSVAQIDDESICPSGFEFVGRSLGNCVVSS